MIRFFSNRQLSGAKFFGPIQAWDFESERVVFLSGIEELRPGRHLVLDLTVRKNRLGSPPKRSARELLTFCVLAGDSLDRDVLLPLLLFPIGAIFFVPSTGNLRPDEILDRFRNGNIASSELERFNYWLRNRTLFEKIDRIDGVFVPSRGLVKVLKKNLGICYRRNLERLMAENPVIDLEVIEIGEKNVVVIQPREKAAQDQINRFELIYLEARRPDDVAALSTLGRFFPIAAEATRNQVN